MRKSTVLFSAALLGSVGVCAWLLASLNRERAFNAELRAQLGEQSNRFAIASVAMASPKAEPTDASSPIKSSTTETTPESAGSILAPSANSSGGDEWLQYQQQLMRDPKYREARRAQGRLQRVQRRTAMVSLLGFTPEQVDAAIELEIDQEFKWMDENPSMHNTKEEIKTAQARYENMERERQDKLRALVGETKRARLQAYLESLPSRQQVDSLRAELSGANALRDDQVEPLI